jgi:MFS family permease
MSAFYQQLATSATVLGAIIGSIYASGPSAKFGAKRVLFVVNANWIVGGVLCLFADFWTLAVGRFILGVGVGIASCAAPVLLSEIAPDEKRGTVTGFHQLQVTIGILCSGIVAYGFVTYVSHGWRYVLSLPMVIGVIILSLEKLIPNSPLWLVRNGRIDEAKATISKLRFGTDVSTPASDPAVSLDPLESSVRQSASFSSSVPSDTQLMEQEQRQITVEDIVHQLQQDDEKERAANAAPVSWGEVFANKKAVLLGLGIMFFQPMSGINTIIFYATKIFGFAGVKQDILATVSVGVVNVFMTVVSMYASWRHVCLLDRIVRPLRHPIVARRSAHATGRPRRRLHPPLRHGLRRRPRRCILGGLVRDRP